MAQPQRRAVGLVVDSRQRRCRFGPYAAEILRAEGIGAVETIELGALPAAGQR